MKKVIAIRKNVEEGITDYLPSMDSVSAFGRNVADTATFGGYKYARAGADYVAKKALKAAGLSKKDTTYSRELDQEKEKLARDDVKNPQAAAAGDIAGMGAMAVAPEIPGVGAAIGSAMKGGETASKIPSYLGLARRAVGMNEEVPANATGAAIPGSGDTGEAFKPTGPIRRRGKFAGQPTFIVSPGTFNSLKEAKRMKKHWRTYLNEDDAYHDLREYAKNCKGPIIVEDERTGACMYVRYGKNGSINEAWTNSVDRRSGSWLSSAGRHIEDTDSKKIGNYDKGHSVHREDDSGDTHFHLVHNETGKITHSVNGKMRKGVLDIHGAGAMPKNKLNKIKMQDFYHHMLRKGSAHEAAKTGKPNRHPVALKGTDHSPGAQGVWQKLAKKPRATVHGWHKGKAVNLGKADDPEETHANATSYSWSGHKSGASKEENEIGQTALVASVAPAKKKFKRKMK